jgi:DNA-binding MarR family transcriptional regulator
MGVRRAKEASVRGASWPAGGSEAVAARIDLEELPGHCIRRLQQIAVAIFLEETAATGVTPVQYAALQAVANQEAMREAVTGVATTARAGSAAEPPSAPAIDQRTLARLIGFDTSTIAGVIDRLEARGLLRRHASPADRRVRLLALTDEGRAMLDRVVPGMRRAQERMLAPLPAGERAEFLRMLRTLVKANNELSRAPSETP